MFLKVGTKIAIIILFSIHLYPYLISFSKKFACVIKYSYYLCSTMKIIGEQLVNGLAEEEVSDK